jgi:hypothetical protein
MTRDLKLSYTKYLQIKPIATGDYVFYAQQLFVKGLAAAL